MIRVRLTPEQHKAYTERGADIWLKRVISEKAGNYIMDKSCKGQNAATEKWTL
jgi:hypothetical protein